MIALERILPRASAQYGARNALYSHGRWITFAELSERVYRLAGAFVSMNLSPGDRIAILDVNSPEYVETYYAAAHIGCVLVAINSRLSVPELEYILQDCLPRVLIVGASHVSNLEHLRARNVIIANTVVIGGDCDGAARYEDLLSASVPIRHCHPSLPDEVASIYYTSGTTGEPKGVCLTHSNMCASALDVIVGLGLGANDVWLHAAPLFHLVDAWAVWALPIIGAGQATVHFTPDAFLSACEAAKITHAALPPTLINLLCERLEAKPANLSSLKQIMYGGSPMPQAVLDAAQRLIPARLTNSYGATETSGTMTLVQATDPSAAHGAGMAVVSAIVDIIDIHGKSVPSGIPGEIVVSGPRVMAGYWNKLKATKEAIVEGRYHTGDIGYFDSTGNLFVADRKKDMIITGGENVYSAEVEAVLGEHPGIMECAVIGIPHERWVEAVHAVVVASQGGSLKAEELIAFCRGKIAPYKIPKSVSFVEERLPRSATGKIIKHKIRSWFSDQAKRHN